MLPQRVEPAEVDKLTDFLRSKAYGATSQELAAGLGFGERKLEPMLDAAKTWGFVRTDGGRVQLTPEGRELARADEATRTRLYAQAAHLVPEYRSTLEWAYYQEFEALDPGDVMAHWAEYFSGAVSKGEDGLRRQVLSFFQFAEAAGFGKYVRGGAASATRLIVDRARLRQLVDTPVEPASEPTAQGEEEQEVPQLEARDAALDEPGQTAEVSSKVVESRNRTARIYLSHIMGEPISTQLSTLLAFGGFDVAAAEDGSVFDWNAMRDCQGAIIWVDSEEDISPGTWLELGGALALLNGRVLVLTNGTFPEVEVPDDLIVEEVGRDQLSWDDGVRLMKVLREFQMQLV